MSQVALVTGASSNLGRAITDALSTKGYTILATTSKQLDITSLQSCQKFLAKTKKLDLVVNVAGLTLSGPGLNSDPQELSRLLDINCVGTFRLLKTALPLLKISSGKFITICSLSGLVSFPNYSLYSASKFALRGLCLSLHHELLRQNVFLTCLSPGAIANPGVPRPSDSARARLPFLNWLLPLTSAGQVADSVVAVATSPNPPAEVVVGRDAQILYGLFRYLPGGVWYFLQRLVWARQQ